MDQDDIRLECLRLAEARGSGAQEVVETAQVWTDFVLEGNDTKVIRAAREFAKKICPCSL